MQATVRSHWSVIWATFKKNNLNSQLKTLDLGLFTVRTVAAVAIIAICNYTLKLLLYVQTMWSHQHWSAWDAAVSMPMETVDSEDTTEHAEKRLTLG